MKLVGTATRLAPVDKATHACPICAPGAPSPAGLRLFHALRPVRHWCVLERSVRQLEPAAAPAAKDELLECSSCSSRFRPGGADVLAADMELSRLFGRRVMCLLTVASEERDLQDGVRAIRATYVFAFGGSIGGEAIEAELATAMRDVRRALKKDELRPIRPIAAAPETADPRTELTKLRDACRSERVEPATAVARYVADAFHAEAHLLRPQVERRRVVRAALLHAATDGLFQRAEREIVLALARGVGLTVRGLRDLVEEEIEPMAEQRSASVLPAVSPASAASSDY